MKRSTALVGLTSLVISIVLIACQDSIITEKEPRLLEFEVFEKMGSLHNEFLTNVKNNLLTDEAVNSLNGRIDYLNNFQKDFLYATTFSDSIKGFVSQEFDRNKMLADLELTKRLVLADQDQIKEEDTVSVFTLLQVADQNNILDTFELRTLTKMAELARMGFEGTITDYQFVRALEKMKTDWLSMGYVADEDNGYVSGYAIAISLASMDWWEANPDACMLEKKGTTVLIPAWAVADAVGALWGATSGAIGSYVINGEIKWGSVGFGALSGAVAGSTGVVGKVAKWISKSIN